MSWLVKFEERSRTRRLSSGVVSWIGKVGGGSTDSFQRHIALRQYCSMLRCFEAHTVEVRMVCLRAEGKIKVTHSVSPIDVDLPICINT